MKVSKIAVLLLSITSLLPAADDMVGVIHGTVVKIDSASKVIVVKTLDGAKFTVKIAESTAIHGFNGGKAAWHGIENGTQIAAHGTKEGVQFAATEVDNLGKGGLKMAKVTITGVDKAGRFVVVKTATGATETYRFASNSAHRLAKGMTASPQVNVYYIEEKGEPVVHFLVQQS